MLACAIYTGSLVAQGLLVATVLTFLYCVARSTRSRKD